MWSSCGKNTKCRPAMLICVDRRAPLVPMGSLMTCTMMARPSNTCFSIGTSGWPVRAAAASPSACFCQTSATCKKAALSRPMSMKADCMPGKTRATLPKYTLPTRPRSSVRSTCSSCTAPNSTTATRVSWGDQLTKISCCMEASDGKKKKTRPCDEQSAIKKPRSTAHAQGPQQSGSLEQRQTHDA
jgi:hypothetical protein